MRVGILDYANDGLRSGVEYYTLGVIRCLASYTDEIELVVYTNDPETVSNVHPRISVQKIPGRRFKAKRLWWQHVCLPRQAEVDGLDVLHCPAYVMPFRRCRVPCVITVHDLHAVTSPQWCSLGNRLHYGFALGQSLRRAAGVIAVSEDTREAILHHFGADVRAGREDIRVIPPGIDNIFTGVTDPADDADCRRRYSLPDRYILHVGNVEPRKNIPAAVEAVRLLRQRGISHTLVFAGKTGRASAPLIRVLSDARNEGIVQTLGYVARADLPALYRMAEAVVCVAHHEGFGFPALEAMACGTPVISSMTGAMGKTLGDAALAVDAASAPSIAEALMVVINDAALRAKLRTAGRDRAADFRWEVSAGELRQIYRIACQKHAQKDGLNFHEKFS